jgi:hypothetical protein
MAAFVQLESLLQAQRSIEYHYVTNKKIFFQRNSLTIIMLKIISNIWRLHLMILKGENPCIARTIGRGGP